MDKRDCIYPDCRLKSKDGFVSCEHSCPFWDTAKDKRYLDRTQQTDPIAKAEGR